MRASMNRLTLKKTASLYGKVWTFKSKDYVVLDAGIIIGRIVWSHSAPEGRHWLWTINTRGRRSSYDFGYSPSRRQAMVAFKARWSRSLNRKTYAQTIGQDPQR